MKLNTDLLSTFKIKYDDTLHVCLNNALYVAKISEREVFELFYKDFSGINNIEFNFDKYLIETLPISKVLDVLYCLSKYKVALAELYILKQVITNDEFVGGVNKDLKELYLEKISR